MAGSAEIDRRSLLKLGLLTAAGSMLPIGCGGSGSRNDVLRLPKVDVQADRVIRQIAGLRPFRRSGFVVRRETVGDKLLVHNYGHGGCGVTISWGSSDLAVNLAMDAGTRTAAVLGCGVIGLSTARVLQDRGFAVTIYAKDLPPDTTSNVAGAGWAPVTLDSPGSRTSEYLEQAAHACRFSHAYFQTMVGSRYGVEWTRIFLVGDQPQDQLPWGYLGVDDLTPLTPLPSRQNPFPTAYASSFYTLLIEMNTYLQALQSDFLARDGKIVVREFANAGEVRALPEELIFNCTGLGAKELFGDPELEPIKGQLTVMLPQPEVQYGYVDGARDFYMFPRKDGIVMGGSHEEGNWDPKPDAIQAARIFEAQKQFFEAMK